MLSKHFNMKVEKFYNIERTVGIFEKSCKEYINFANPNGKLILRF